jgi:DtxR family Mn-dependent transcriptional regulator
MRHLEEEILEAIWVVAETDIPTVEAVARRCDEEFGDDDLERLEAAGRVIRSDEELMLSASGKRKARALVRCHRLAETLLHAIFELSWEAREAIACQVEHTLVPELADGICTLLGHPTECPDGKPIPPGACCVAHRQYVSCQVVPLTDLRRGRRARVLFVKTRTTDRIRQLSACGLVPGTTLTLFQRSPAFGVRFEGTELALDRAVAADILVSPIEGPGDRVGPAGTHREEHPSGKGKRPQSSQPPVNHTQ